MLTTWGQRLPWRTALLALTFTAVWLVLGKVWVSDSRPSEMAAAPVALPEAPPLPGWQLLQSLPITPKLEDNSRGSHAYQFQREGQVLYIDVHYLAPWTDGNISRLLFVNTALRAANAQLQERYHPETGFYGVLTHQGRAYLTACINPQGQSTLTEQQATQNRYTTGLRPWRVLRWLLGQENLWDGRCLWTLMAIQLTPDPPESSDQGETGGSTGPVSPEVAYLILVSAWVPWHRWWQAHFPPPVSETALPKQRS